MARRCWSGEPGIGKTTLLEWVAESSKDLRLLRAAGRESEADLPFVALADLLRPLDALIGSLPAPQARALGSALLLAEAKNGDRLAINAAVTHLLGLAAQAEPLLLLIDDYHWLDSASRDVIDLPPDAPIRSGSASSSPPAPIPRPTMAAASFNSNRFRGPPPPS